MRVVERALRYVSDGLFVRLRCERRWRDISAGGRTVIRLFHPSRSRYAELQQMAHRGSADVLAVFQALGVKVSRGSKM